MRKLHGSIVFHGMYSPLTWSCSLQILGEKTDSHTRKIKQPLIFWLISPLYVYTFVEIKIHVTKADIQGIHLL